MTSHEGMEPTAPAEAPNNAGWATFEARVRGKRFARCLDRADTAISQGHFDAARDAIAEARALSPHAPEITQLEERMDAAANRAESAGIPEVSQVDPQELERDPGWLGVAGAMAALVLLFSLFGFGIVQLYFAAPAQQLMSGGLDSAAADTPAPAATSGRAADVTTALAPATEGSGIAPSATSSTVTSPTAAASPEVLTAPTATAADAENVAPRATSGASRSRGDHLGDSGTSRAVSSATTAPAPRPWRWRQPPSQPLTTPDQSLPPSPAAGADSPSMEPVPVPSSSSFSAPEASMTPGIMRTSATEVVPAAVSMSPEEARRLESARIRALLLRYENAYNRLDANAAASIWPGADHTALERAFNGLNSQRVSLGLCDITVIGDIGGASCVGKARWEPRIGGGLHTADRQWTFNLRKIGNEWRIEQIRVRDLES